MTRLESRAVVDRLRAMLADPVATDALRRVLDAFESVGYPRDVVCQWAIPVMDANDLIEALHRAQSQKILEVGTFVGTSALLMLLCCPHAEVHSIDPNFPLSVEFDAMNCNHRAADLARRTQDIAAAAAELLGVRDRLHLHEGGFSTDATFAGRVATTKSIGAEIIARHGPFDAAFIDGLHFEQAVRSDLRLAASGLRPSAPIILHDCIGYWGSSVRRAIGRFLEETPQYSLSHAPYADLYRSVATLSCDPNSCSRVAMRPFQERLSKACEGNEARLPELIARALSTQLPPLCVESRDAESGVFAAAFASSAGAPRLVVAIDTLDQTSHDELDRTIQRLAFNTDAMVLGLTPPGEECAASMHSRPLASSVAALDRAGFDSFDVIVPFLEPFTYALGHGCVLPVRTSFLSTTMLAIRRGSALATVAAENGFDRVSPTDARRIDATRTQRMHDLSSLARFRANCESLTQSAANANAAAQSIAQPSDARSAHTVSLESRLQHMLDWRIHIGRHHFWRRRDAKI